MLTGQLGVVVADADHLVDVGELHLARVVRVQLEPVQVNEQSRPAALVAAVPDGVRAAPFADHHIGPVGQFLGHGLVVLAERRPLVDPDFEARLQPEVLDQRLEELQVMARDHHAQRPRGSGNSGGAGPEDVGGDGAGQVAAQAFRGAVQGELGRGVRDVVQARGE